MRTDTDYIVIGSGFGGSVSALRLAEKGYRVTVIEMGRRWHPETLPRSTWDVRHWIWRPRLGLNGFFNIRFFRHVTTLHGHAVGGGSITYGNTLIAPPPKVWRQGTWAGLADWEHIMPRHFETARRMLGVNENREPGEADARLMAMARACGLERTYRRTEVATLFAGEGEQPGAERPDPYFGGEGPARRTCTACGGCMIGCRYDAKNTLDRNYLYLAEKRGARVLAETKAIDIRPLGAADGRDGYAVTCEPSLDRLGPKRVHTCRGVVFAASSVGTQELLLRMKDNGSLPRLSDALGNDVRTNAESLIGVRYPGTSDDLSKGVAIGSGVHLDEHTHVQAVRYPDGSGTLGLLTTVMTLGAPGPRRILAWLAALGRMMATRPITTARMLLPWRFSRETVILLCMQSLESSLKMRLKRRWFWPFGKLLVTEGDDVPAFIPEANAFAVKGAEATGGVAATSLIEILFNISITAHCMGGAVMARTPSQGVCDEKCRVFGYENMLVCDGSVLSANLGVNPSLTITALAEHAMSYIPEAGVSSPGRTAEAA